MISVNTVYGIRKHEIKLELSLTDNELSELTNILGSTTHMVFEQLYIHLNNACVKYGLE